MVYNIINVGGEKKNKKHCIKILTVQAAPFAWRSTQGEVVTISLSYNGMWGVTVA